MKIEGWLGLMRSDRGSTFWLCQRSPAEPAFPKYPPLPMIQCAGYEQEVVNDAHALLHSGRANETS
jgi:hypothetical protein